MARSILETLNDVDPNDIQRVMAVISRLASDTGMKTILIEIYVLCVSHKIVL